MINKHHSIIFTEDFIYFKNYYDYPHNSSYAIVRGNLKVKSFMRLNNWLKGNPPSFVQFSRIGVELYYFNHKE